MKPRFGEVLVRFHDGELSCAQQVSVNERLGRDPFARAHLKRLQQTREALNTWANERSRSADLADAIMAQLGGISERPSHPSELSLAFSKSSILALPT